MRISLAAQRLVAVGLVALSLGYLATFVSRGWMPLDDGMLGQAAERVLAGQVPHVDFQDPYTGGLSWLHAAVFSVTGIDLIYLRWTLFAGAVAAQVLIYLILRRFLSPIGAAFAAWVALAFSFPNYFNSMPSWWVLICALACLWAYLRHVESGQLRFAVIAGFAAGGAVLFKQTGIYILAALIISLLYAGVGEESPRRQWWPGRVACVTVAIGAVIFAAGLMSGRPALADLVYLLLPILACSRVLATADGVTPSLTPRQSYAAPWAAIAAASLLVLGFTATYVARGDLEAFVRSAVILPLKRGQFASAEMPSGAWILAGVPIAGMLLRHPEVLRSAHMSRAIAAIVAGGGLALVAISAYDQDVYQVVWQSTRAGAALLPVAACMLLLSASGTATRDRRVLFGCVAMLSWASLVQLPYSAPNYFCYVAPLAVIAGVSLAQRTGALRRPLLGAYAAVLLVFAIGIMHRGYIFNLGLRHRLAEFDTPLGIERADLTVHRVHATSYGQVLEVVRKHLNGRLLVAGPDTPEIYFLAGRFSPTGAFYDFFNGLITEEGAITDLPGWEEAGVVVLCHCQAFSSGPSPALVNGVRQRFPNVEWAGALEIRWRP